MKVTRNRKYVYSVVGGKITIIMKKKIISTILMSTVVLSATVPLSGVCADTNSDIAKQDVTISSAQSAKAQAQAKVDRLQSKVDSL